MNRADAVAQRCKLASFATSFQNTTFLSHRCVKCAPSSAGGNGGGIPGGGGGCATCFFLLTTVSVFSKPLNSLLPPAGRTVSAPSTPAPSPVLLLLLLLLPILVPPPLCPSGGCCAVVAADRKRLPPSSAAVLPAGAGEVVPEETTVDGEDVVDAADANPNGDGDSTPRRPRSASPG